MPPRTQRKRKQAAKSQENTSTGAKSGAPELTEANSESESTKDASVDASNKKSKRSGPEQSKEGVNESILQDATQEHAGVGTKSANDETIETSLQGDECNTGINGEDITMVDGHNGKCHHWVFNSIVFKFIPLT